MGPCVASAPAGADTSGETCVDAELCTCEESAAEVCAVDAAVVVVAAADAVTVATDTGVALGT